MIYVTFDILKDIGKFLKSVEELEPYLLELKTNNITKNDIYPKDCQISWTKWWSVICIIHDRSIILANNQKDFLDKKIILHYLDHNENKKQSRY